MDTVLLVRYGEIHLKGLNRPFFEAQLMRGIRACLRTMPGCSTDMTQGRIYVRGFADERRAIDAVRRVFGVHSLSVALELEDKSMAQVFQAAIALMQGRTGTFKVNARRSDKRYPLNSMDINVAVGEAVLGACPQLRVDVHTPDTVLSVEIREKAYVYTDAVKAVGGMPMGTNGKAFLLLSGGIDSPVAGYMVARRGVALEAVHFFSFPYTGERAKEKVMSLTRILSGYCGRIKLHVVPFTRIQEELYEKCPQGLLTVLMRRVMMRIAGEIAYAGGGAALITGESIGQVASQTLDAMLCTNDASPLPVFRPLIGMDKQDIMDIAREIGTYETSILPYEDCCTVFVPRHPITHPKLEKVLEAEALLDVDALAQEAIEKTETCMFTAQGE